MNPVERLEARQLLSASFLWQINGLDGGNNPADEIVVEAVPGKPDRLRAVMNGEPVFARPIGKIGGITINAGEGNDLVRVRLGARFAGLRTTVIGGAGDDVLIGGATRDKLRGGRGDDRLDGRANADIVRGQSGADEIRRESDGDVVVTDEDDSFVSRIRARMIVPEPSGPEPEPEPEPEPWFPPGNPLPDPQPLDESPAATVPDAMSAFGIALYRELIEGRGEENLLFSPSSLVTTLSMLLPAARGQTLDQMLSAMRLPRDVSEVLGEFAELTAPVTGNPPYTLSNANAFWHDPRYPVLEAYREAVQSAFAAVVDELDLSDRAEAERIIDAWAGQNTDGMIEDIVDPDFFTDTMTVVFGNAVYFKGNWVDPFHPDQTYDAPFLRPDGTTVDVPMMHQLGTFRAYYGQGFDVVVLPYEGERFSMVVVVPDRGNRLDELAQVVTPESLGEWVSAAQDTYFMLGLPKFELLTRLEPIELEALLKSLGMSDVFSVASSDLSGMTGVRDGLRLEKVVHAARIEVSEEGTRAAAVTVGGGGVCSGPPRFSVDRPFLFAIRDDTNGAIQFLGQVTDPG